MRPALLLVFALLACEPAGEDYTDEVKVSAPCLSVEAVDQKPAGPYVVYACPTHFTSLATGFVYSHPMGVYSYEDCPLACDRRGTLYFSVTGDVATIAGVLWR
jgi:hypothetical protein